MDRLLTKFWLMFALVSWIGITFLTSGCGTAHYQKTYAVQEAMIRGDFADADTLLSQLRSNFGEKDALLYYLDKGMIGHLQENYETSNYYFELALEKIESLYAKSISKEALTYITNDLAQPYRGEDFEKVLIHYYMALNYLMMNNLESALVECRRVDLTLTELNDKYKKKNRYKSDAFVHYLMGMIYEADGDINDAFIAYRNAYETYESDYEEFYGLSAPLQLKRDLLRTSKTLAFQQEYNKYEKAFPNVIYRPQKRYRENSELILIWDNGLVPFKSEGRLNLQIDDEGADDYIQIAFPVYQRRPPQGEKAEISVGGKSARSEVYEDLSDIAIKNLEDRSLRIMAKGAIRAGLKYGLQKSVEKEYGETAGCLVNIFNVATEQADTRGWITLPDNIQVARLLCPPGRYTVLLTLKSWSGGTMEQVRFDNIELKAGKKKFLHHRTFR